MSWKRGEIESLALETLRDCGIVVPSVDVGVVLQGSDCIPYVALDMPHDMDGGLVPGYSCHVISAHGRLNHQRRRFVFMHMLGHLLMHPHGTYACAMARSPLLREDEQETEASIFAAFTLMPRAWCQEACKRGYSVQKMATMFRVSPQAVKIHLFDLGLFAPEEREVRDCLQFFSLTHSMAT